MPPTFPHRQSSPEPIAGSDGNYMTKQHLSVIRQLAEQLDAAVPAGQLLPDWAESKVGVAAAALKDVAGWLMAERDPARRTAAATVTVRVKGRPEQFTGELDALRSVLRRVGVAEDRLRVVLPAFASEVTLLPGEVKHLLRARVLLRAVESPRVVDWGRPQLPGAAAQRLYDRLVARLVDTLKPQARDGSENPFDLAEGGYDRYRQEFEQLVPALGLERDQVIDTIVEAIA